MTEEPLDPNVPQRDDAAAMTDQSGGGVIASEGILGRDRELETVASLVSRAATGGGALLIRGDAGIGKAALLERAVALARAAGMRVLLTTGVRTEANLPFAGLHQLLRPILGGLARASPGPRVLRGQLTSSNATQRPVR